MLSLLFTLMAGLPNAQAKTLNTADLVTRYMAKEYCSCRFVVKQSPKVCKDENKTFRILFRIREDQTKKVIRVSNIFEKAEARFIDERQGCQLVVK
ncbi:MAG: hypothetical protein AAF203_08970 [Pseudomonadota bacterium]